MKFLLIVTGWNCQNYVQKCFHSIRQQGYPNWEAVFISDGSTDRTKECFPEIEKHKQLFKVRTFHYEENKGAAFRRWEAIKESDIGPEDVIILIGMDDELQKDALKTIADTYKLNGVLMTYGNWSNQNGRLNTAPLDFDTVTHHNRDYRQVSYRATAPNTFKKKLFDCFTEDDFKLDGAWLKNCTETNLMISLCEMCGKDRIGVIRQPIYMYNQGLHNGTIARFGGEDKSNNVRKIMALPKKELYVESN